MQLYLAGVQLSTDVILFGLGLASTLFLTGLSAYVKIISRLRELEVRVAHNEATDASILHKLDQQNSKLESINDKLTEIWVALADKQDRE